jgi:SAM-dependent methyltransferase
MKKATEMKSFEMEKQHFWYVSRRALLGSLLRKYFKKEANILDVGCGSGYNLKFLSQYFPNIKGIDLSKDSIEYGERFLGLKNIKLGDAYNPEGKEGTLDGILALDVLEHIKEDRQALERWLNLLKPGGKVILTVPAFNFLWRKHDSLSHHKRRYTKKKMKELTSPGFRIIFRSYWNKSSFFPVLILKYLEKIGFSSGDGGFESINPILNKYFLRRLLKENKRIFKKRLGYGVSLVCVIQKNRI